MVNKIEELIQEGHTVTLTLKSGKEFEVNGIQDGPKTAGLGRFFYIARPHGNKKRLIALKSDEIAAYTFSIAI